MKALIEKDYEGLLVQFTGEGWFNATAVAERYGKRPNDWLVLVSTQEYIAAICEHHKVSRTHFIKTKRGNTSFSGNSGTWLHPKLGVLFARWLDVRFAIWCDEQIDKLIRGELDAKKARHQAAASFKLMTDVLKLKREEAGKLTKPHHYINEARLINWALTGQFTKLDRDSLSHDQLDLLAMLEERNALMIAAELRYELRKQALTEFMERLSRGQVVPTNVFSLPDGE